MPAVFSQPRDPTGRLLLMVPHLGAERKFLVIVCTPNSLEFHFDFFFNSELLRRLILGKSFLGYMFVISYISS